MIKKLSGSEIRQSFIEFFQEHKHTVVPSTSLVPGGDSTLLFTNAGMVQFKDVFLGTDKRPYSRAVNSQKCMRVAGKHNDLEDVGRDDSHHTFFEMLGNWSFGDYYKKEAIMWAWQLLTDVWELPKDKLFATCFKDERGEIPTDTEAAEIWKLQPGFDESHVMFFGRKENFWEMAEVGPCGPCSEIHIDRGEEFDNLAGKPHICGINGECTRYLELWNNVFIQYNRISSEILEPLPATHVDTGMGFERIVSIIQGVDSNYKIDLFEGITDVIRSLTGDTPEKMYDNFTPYRVIADHVRAATFLIADGVVPGNIGRNYICRMIIRRAARFGTKLGLKEPFLAKAAEAVIGAYCEFYPELKTHQISIIENLTREEIRFASTIESGLSYLQDMLEGLKESKDTVLDGGKVFDLYATYGLPFEIARDIAREQDLELDDHGFRLAMEEHRLASGGGRAMGKMGGEDAEFYGRVIKDLSSEGKLNPEGVEHIPYDGITVEGSLLSLVVNGLPKNQASAGDKVEVMIPISGFYIESGGQVSDTGIIQSKELSASGEPRWKIEVDDVRKPAAGAIIHLGEVIYGIPINGDKCVAVVDFVRRHDIMRNHTATHLLHAALYQVLGKTARQAGSLVAPDHLRFDFTYPKAMTADQILKVEEHVNQAITADMHIESRLRTRDEAIKDGAMALFGEKYGEIVRTITINPEGENSESAKYSFELCGGTHLDRTSDVGVFLIISESSAAAGIRRIEAVTGRGAYKLISHRFAILKDAAAKLKTAMDEVPTRIDELLLELMTSRKEAVEIKNQLARTALESSFSSIETVKDINVLVLEMPDVDKDTLSHLADVFRENYPEGGICVIGTTTSEQAIVMVTVTQDLIKRGIRAGEIARMISLQLGAGGGGAPHLAFGGGKDMEKLRDALLSVKDWLSTQEVNP